ncbi:MAG: Hsp33 family molecular chaperone HslO [Acutalibacteraceae bacterium]|jgi:molecular chaperone Hsp33
MSKAIRCLTKDATVMAMAIDSTAIAARAEQIHQTSAVVTAALGRLLTAASMMGIMLKGQDDSLTLKITADGPAGTLTTVSDSLGNVRGCVDHPVVEIPLKPNGKLDVSGAVGQNGMLYVMRDTGGAEPYIGCTPLVSGEIAEDVTSYYALSEQTPTVCALGVLVNPDLSVKKAGGLLLQLLPFCPESVIDKIEENVAKLPSMTAMLDGGMTVEDIVAKALDGMEFDVLDEYEPDYRCTCSRQKIERAFLTMKPEDVRDLPDENGMVEATCSFCDKVYRFTREDLQRLLKTR